MHNTTNRVGGYAGARTSRISAAAPDFGLSVREVACLGTSTFDTVKDLVRGKSQQRSMAVELSEELAKRFNIPLTGRNLVVPTSLPICAPSWLDVQRRDLTVGTNSAGGYLRATDNISFIELLRNRMVAFAMGAQRLSGLVGNVTVPKQAGGATAYWLANEATAITEGNQTFGQLALTPRTVAAYTQVSRLLQLQSSPDIEAVVWSDLAAQVSIAADLAVLAGTGTEQPTGITQTAGIGSVSGTSIDYADLLEFQSDVAANNALAPSCGYVTTPAIAALLAQRVKVASTYSPLWEGSINDGRVAGFKAMTSNQCPSGTIIFGDFQQVVVGEWGVLELAVNPFDDFAKAITGLRATYTLDVGVRYAGAFSVATSVT